MKSGKISQYKIEILILTLIIGFSLYRSPFIFLNGRFIGEEATHHFMSALNNNFFKNLIYFDNVSGYFNLIPNILSEISTYLPIEYAPMVTVYGSFLIIINLSFICLFNNSYFLNTKIKRITVSLLLFITPPFVSEIWINSLNSQIYLCLSSILILLIKNNEQKNNSYLHLNILIAGLSGIYTCVLTPFFLIRFLESKTRYNLLNFFIILSCSIIQTTIILYSRFTNTLMESKFNLSLNSEHFTLFIYNNMAKPVFGRQLTHLIYEKVNVIFLIILVLSLILFFVFEILKKKNFEKIKKDFVLQFLVLIFVFYTFVILIGSVNGQLGGRYAVIPGVIFLLIIFQFISFFEQKWIKFFLSLFIISSILSGFYEFRPPTENVRHQYIKYLDCINCPIWKDEVLKWKEDKDYRLGLWPYPLKKLKLKIENN